MTSPAPGNIGEMFTIRGHHLANFTSLMIGETPASWASKSRAVAEADRGNLTAETVDFSNLEGNSPRYRATYSFDLIGETREQGDQSEAAAADALQAFLDLPDDAPVELTKTPDILCGSCIFKQHCQLPATAGIDEQVLGVFRDVTEHLVANGEQVTSRNIAENSIRTDAATVRSFMGFMALQKATHNTFYADAVRARARFGHVFGSRASAAKDHITARNTVQ